MNETRALPTEITLRRAERRLTVAFDDGACFDLPYEYLRVYSPSAEVQGHHGQGAKLQVGKEQVDIKDLQQVGNYALKLFFNDGHKSGLFTWRYLYELGSRQEEYWQDYLARLAAAGHARAE